MSWSKAQICNMALAKAGSSRTIQGLASAEGQAVSEEQRQCELFWDLAVEAAARTGNFACLQAPVTLAAVTAAVLPDYPYSYALPADYLGWPEFPEDADTVSRRIQRVLYTDRAVTTMIYAARPRDTDQLDPLFVECLVLRLAAWLSSGPVGGNDKEKAAWLDRWREQVAQPIAEFVNATEVQPAVIDSSAWRRARG